MSDRSEPVPHDDPTSGRVTRTISLATSSGRGANMAPKMLDEVERTIFQLVRGCIALLKVAVRKALGSCTLVPRLDQVARDVDSTTSAPRLAAGSAVVPSPHPRSNTSAFVIPSPSTSASPLSLMPWQFE
jgi:hypothetical protein